jgi:hypothetical protein
VGVDPHFAHSLARSNHVSTAGVVMSENSSLPTAPAERFRRLILGVSSMGLPPGSWSAPKARRWGGRLPRQRSSGLMSGLGRRCDGRLGFVYGLFEHEVDVGGVVDELGVLDVLAEAGIGDGRDEGQHRSEQVGGSLGFAARYGLLPGGIRR